jgi:hypothetical protein
MEKRVVYIPAVKKFKRQKILAEILKAPLIIIFLFAFIFSIYSVIKNLDYNLGFSHITFFGIILLSFILGNTLKNKKVSEILKISFLILSLIVLIMAIGGGIYAIANGFEGLKSIHLIVFALIYLLYALGIYLDKKH